MDKKRKKNLAKVFMFTPLAILFAVLFYNLFIVFGWYTLLVLGGFISIGIGMYLDWTATFG